MTKSSGVLALVLIFLAGSVGLAFAQRAGVPGERQDEDDRVTLAGRFTSVERPLATFEAAGKPYTVHLGPLWYWNERGYTLSPGEPVTISGQIDRVGKAVHLYLHTLVRGEETYVFTDEDGVPLWSRGRGRAAGRCAGPGHCPCCARGAGAGRPGGR